jgi:hypothetical protein
MERVITKKYLMNKLGAKCRKKIGNSGIALWDQRRFLNLLTFRLKSVDQIRFWEDKQLGTQH